MIDTGLKDKIVIVTGANHGIGAAAIELRPYGITVNVISPGAVQTGWINSGLEKSLIESYPLRRIGKPEDIA